jgi:protein-S-isoprenylcysteine O-methyltransferase Ste14
MTAAAGGGPEREWSPVRARVSAALGMVVVPLLPLLITGRWLWWEGWAYAAILMGSYAARRVLWERRHGPPSGAGPGRGRVQGYEPWGRLLAPILGAALIPVVAGLDVALDLSPSLTLPLRLAGLAGLVAGIWVSTMASVANPYFYGVEQIEAGRGHAIISTGPYGWVRHPGYAGTILAYLASPILLEALWAIVPALLLSLLALVRVAVEDRTLRATMPGYQEYAERVRYGLVPGIW